MPRVSQRAQFKRHQSAREIYVAKRSTFSYVDARGQAALHAFYQPHKDHLQSGLAAHQYKAAKRDRSLPHRAGKAYAALVDAADALAHAELERPIVRGHRKG